MNSNQEIFGEAGIVYNDFMRFEDDQRIRIAEQLAVLAVAGDKVEFELVEVLAA